MSMIILNKKEELVFDDDETVILIIIKDAYEEKSLKALVQFDKLGRKVNLNCKIIAIPYQNPAVSMLYNTISVYPCVKILRDSKVIKSWIGTPYTEKQLINLLTLLGII